MEPTPTADLDRTNDKVYDCTTSVVRAVMSLSQGESVMTTCDIYAAVMPRDNVEGAPRIICMYHYANGKLINYRCSTEQG